MLKRKCHAKDSVASEIRKKELLGLKDCRSFLAKKIITCCFLVECWLRYLLIFLPMHYFCHFFI